MYLYLLFYCRVTCTTGVKEGSVVSDKVFIQFAHHSDVVQSEENFEFVVSFKAMQVSVHDDHLH